MGRRVTPMKNRELLRACPKRHIVLAQAENLIKNETRNFELIGRFGNRQSFNDKRDGKPPRSHSSAVRLA